MRPGVGKITEVKFAIRVIRVFGTRSYEDFRCISSISHEKWPERSQIGPK